MAITILSNKKGTSAVIHVTSANGSLIISGNSTQSNIAMGDEVLTGAAITQVFFGIDPSSSGHAVIKRGSNLVSVYDSTGYVDYAGNGMSLTKDAAANLVFEFSSSANAYLLVEVQKFGKFSTDY